mmetsp:Transcript_32272/g.94379  ORF Transcript_32272/g.94379 Transcript_32272/m.94379 type:complete len:437 (-) Transcript_32272:814-2124(-)
MPLGDQPPQRIAFQVLSGGLPVRLTGPADLVLGLDAGLPALAVPSRWCCIRRASVWLLLGALLALCSSEGLCARSTTFHRGDRCRHRCVRGAGCCERCANCGAHETLGGAGAISARILLHRRLQFCGGRLGHLRAGQGGIQGLKTERHGRSGFLGQAGCLRIPLGCGTALGGDVEAGVADDADCLDHRQCQHDRRVRDGLRQRIMTAALLAPLPRRLCSVGGLVREFRSGLRITRSLLRGLACLPQQLGIRAFLRGCGLRISRVLAGTVVLAVAAFSLALGARALLRSTFCCLTFCISLSSAGRPCLFGIFVIGRAGAAAVSCTALLHNLLIGIRQLLEILFVATLIWVALHGHQAVGALDFGIGGIRGNAQDCICGVLMKSCNLVHDFALETHLPQNVLIQRTVHFFQLIRRHRLSLRFRLLLCQLELTNKRRIA